MQKWSQKVRKNKDQPSTEPAPDRSTILPRIKTPEFLNSLHELQIRHDQMPVTEPLVGNLLITYCFDLPGIFQMVTYADLTRIGISRYELNPISIANLRQRVREIGTFQPEGSPLMRIVTGGDLEACVLLATPFWDNIQEEMQSEIVAAVPSRDVLIFCSSNSSEGIELLRQSATNVLQAESVHALSDQLLVWRNSRWMIY